MKAILPLLSLLLFFLSLFSTEDVAGGGTEGRGGLGEAVEGEPGALSGIRRPDRIIFQQAGWEPVDAYRALLDRYKAPDRQPYILGCSPNRYCKNFQETAGARYETGSGRASGPVFFETPEARGPKLMFRYRPKSFSYAG